MSAYIPYLLFLVLAGSTCREENHNPPLTAQNRHRLTRLARTQLKALTIIEAGAAGSFLWLLSFAEKESDDIASAIPEKGKRQRKS